MKGNFPKLILAVLVAVAIFAALRTRESAPTKPLGATGEASQAETTPPARVPAAAAPKGPREKPAEAAPINREPASPRSPLELFAELFRRGEWTAQRGGDGRPTGLRGTPIPGATGDAKSALAFAKRLAQQVGANPDQLSDAHSQAETDKGLQTMYKYDQWVGDNPVFGGSMSVFSRRSDSAAYLVNSSLKPVDEAPSGGVDRAQAESLVLAWYKDRGGKIATPIFNDEYIYADQAPTEFAWYFVVSVTSPAFTKLKVLFGATTRRVLYEGPALIN